MPRYILRNLNFSVELSPRTFKRSKPETPNYWRSSRKEEIERERRELKRDKSLLPMPKNTTTSTKLKRKPRLILWDKPRPPEISTFPLKLRSLSPSEPEGKFKVDNFEWEYYINHSSIFFDAILLLFDIWN